jgi:hypothetical protein
MFDWDRILAAVDPLFLFRPRPIDMFENWPILMRILHKEFYNDGRRDSAGKTDLKQIARELKIRYWNDHMFTAYFYAEWRLVELIEDEYPWKLCGSKNDWEDDDSAGDSGDDDYSSLEPANLESAISPHSSICKYHFHPNNAPAYELQHSLRAALSPCLAITMG